VIADQALATGPILLLWGTPVGGDARGEEIRKRLMDLCANLQESANSFSEPDVIIDLGRDGVVFIEVKYRSGNDFRPVNYGGWTRYNLRQLSWHFENVKASGCYELARNWCLLKGLAVERPACLVNLGPAKLFLGKAGRRSTITFYEGCVA
jgi:hypothetical protein